jgi:hypothetical protein
MRLSWFEGLGMIQHNLHRLLVVVLVAAGSGTGLGAESAADRVAFFESKVRPVLVERCVGCHGPEKQKAGLRLDSLVGLLRGSSATVPPGPRLPTHYPRGHRTIGPRRRA